MIFIHDKNEKTSKITSVIGTTPLAQFPEKWLKFQYISCIIELKGCSNE